MNNILRMLADKAHDVTNDGEVYAKIMARARERDPVYDGIDHAAAAALIFPVAMTAAETAGLNPRAFAIALSLAASAGFCTPIGSQPNLLVYGPGGYRYADYTRVGLPLLCLTLCACVIFLPMIWPLQS